MTKKEMPTLSPFGEAAVALDQELTRFRELTDSASRIPLHSRRNLERAAKSTDDALASQARLGELMGKLVEALAAARVENERCGQTLATRKMEIEQRVAEAGRILERFAQLGRIAGEISVFVRQVGELKKSGAGNTETLAAIIEVESRMTTVVDEARALAEAAKEADLEDLVPEIDSLRQQILAARNKTNLVRQRLSD